MSQITSGALAWLARAIGVPQFTSQTTDLEDGLASLVVEIGRTAAWSQSNGRHGGFWIGSCFNVHTIVGSLTRSVDLTAAGSNGFLGMDQAKEWAWVYDAWAITSDSGDTAFAELRIPNITNDLFIGPDDGQNPTSVDHLIFKWETTFDNQMATDLPIISGAPYLIFSPTEALEFESNADNAGTAQIDCNYLVWIGPRGVMPPGVA